MLRMTLNAIVLFAYNPAAYAASDAAKMFGARETIQQASLSPDGKSVALVEAVGDRNTIIVIVATDGSSSKTIARSSGDPDRLQFCRWSTNTRLLCGIYMIADGGNGRLLGFTRMIAMDADGRNVKQLSGNETGRALAIVYDGGDVIDWMGNDAGGEVLMTRNFVAQMTTGSNLTAADPGYGVERVDTLSMRRSIVERPNDEAKEYITDGRGTVRIMGVQPKSVGGYDKNIIRYRYRLGNDRTWKPLSDLRLDGGKSQGFSPVAVDHDKNVAYGFDNNEGRIALYSMALDGTMKHELVLARPDVDIDSLVRIGRQRRVVGASFATERRQIEFFDPTLKRLAASLSKALPGLPLVTFVDASADENRLLLFAGSDVDPGMLYLYDKTTRRLDEVSPARAPLAAIKLATVKAVSYPAADGTMIPGYLTLPPGSDGKRLPAIVMPHGGPGARDEWGFDWLAQFFANRGYAVLQPNFRGSTGYGDAWFADNGFKSWKLAIGDVNDGGRWLIKQGIADPAKAAIVGWSYGGYAALQSAVLDPTLFKAIVAVAPVTDLETLRAESVNFTNHLAVDAFIGHGPHVREGSPAQNAARIAAPVLIFHGDQDRNVGIIESRLMASKLKDAGKQVEFVEFHGLDHQLEDGAIRARMLDKMDGFLRATLGMPAADQ